MSPLGVFMTAICTVIVLFLIILMIVVMIFLGRNKDFQTDGRYNLNIAKQYQGEMVTNKSEQSEDDIQVGHSFSSSSRSLDTVTTTSDREKYPFDVIHDFVSEVSLEKM